MNEFRKVSEPEIPLLLNIAERTFRLAFEGHPSNDPADFADYCDKNFTLEKIREEWSNEQSEFWFSTENQQVTGYFKLNFDQHPHEIISKNSIQIERLYVLAEHQNKRIGVAMLEKIEAIARARGGDFAWLTVWKLNPAAIRFYERFGFEIMGVKIFVLGKDAQEDWMMGKKLTTEL